MLAREALRIVGLPDGFSMTSPGSIRVALERWKQETVRARSAGNDVEASALSQAHEVLKRLARKYCECGEQKHPSTPRCPTCRIKKMASRATLVIEDGVRDDIEVPLVSKVNSFADRLRKLKTAECITIKAKHTPKTNGIIVMSRNIGKGWRRVWRTDGKTLEEVNQIIRDRKHEEKTLSNGNGN
jgi:hypothetical protein